MLAQVYASPQDAGCTEDAFCAARTMLQLRRYSQAEAVFDALKDDFEDAKRELAYLKRTLGSYDEAIVLFDELSSMSRFDASYDIELAKIYEHKMRNYELAVNYALRAKEKAFNNRLLGRQSNIIDDVEKRIKRLNSKLERGKIMSILGNMLGNAAYYKHARGDIEAAKKMYESAMEKGADET